MFTKEINTLFSIIHTGLGTSFQGEELKIPQDINWDCIFRIAQRQGVLAIAWDGISRLLDNGATLTIPRSLKLKWGINSEIVAERYHKQWVAATDIADRFHERGIQTTVLKGFALSQHYPIPEHRPCGDLDCFLMGRYEDGNCTAEACGAKVERDFYVHSHIEYKGLTIENHQFCTPIRGSKKAKDFEREIQQIIKNEPLNPICDSHLLSPSPLFTALHLAHHTRRHFISEGIALRHLIDWAMLVNGLSKEIDWKRFALLLREFDQGLARFAEALMQISSKYFNTTYIELGEAIPENLIDEIVSDTLKDSIQINTNGFGVWRKRWLLISNYYSRHKLYKHFNEGSLLTVIGRAIYGYIFDHNPAL